MCAITYIYMFAYHFLVRKRSQGPDVGTYNPMLYEKKHSHAYRFSSQQRFPDKEKREYEE